MDSQELCSHAELTPLTGDMVATAMSLVKRAGLRRLLTSANVHSQDDASYDGDTDE